MSRAHSWYHELWRGPAKCGDIPGVKCGCLFVVIGVLKGFCLFLRCLRLSLPLACRCDLARESRRGVSGTHLLASISIVVFCVVSMKIISLFFFSSA